MCRYVIHESCDTIYDMIKLSIIFHYVMSLLNNTDCSTLSCNYSVNFPIE